MEQPETTTRWGILGTGRIAATFARDIAVTPGAVLAAVGSRTAESAESFAREHAAAGDGEVRAYASYEQLAADGDLDVVYVSTPHSRHDDDARLLLDAGVPVLCEKPLTLDAATTEGLVRHAQERDVFFMEAMWTACHPLVREAARRVRAGDIGDVRQLRAGLGFPVPPDPDSRMWDPALGASAVLDMGIYPLTLAWLLLGEPAGLAAAGTVDDRGVDTDVAAVLTYARGAVATATVTMTAHSHNDAMVSGDGGRLHLEAPCHHPDRITLTGPDGEVTELVGDEPVIGRGYGNEIAEVQRCLAAGRRESAWWTHADTLALARQMDAVRAHL